MRVKFDDGEHATVLTDVLTYFPAVGHVIDWDWPPKGEDDLLPGRYRVETIEWRIAADTGVFLTVGLIAL